MRSHGYHEPASGVGVQEIVGAKGVTLYGTTLYKDGLNGVKMGSNEFCM